MPLKGQPLRRQPARGTRGPINDDDSAQALSAPSPKELLTVNDNEGQHIPVEAEHADSLNSRPTDSKATDPSQIEQLTSSASTITDSPPPTRPPVQRLTSVLPRNSSTNTLEVTGADVSGVRPSLKFKPKSAVRRSKEEREAEERAEAERRAARQAAGGILSTSDRGSYHGRGRGRGRGGHDDMNRWRNERFILSHSASGHLGGATLREATAGRGGGRGGSHSGGSTGDGAGSAHTGPSDSTATTAGARVKREPKVKPEKDKDGNVVMGSSVSGSISKRTKVKRENQAPNYVSSGSELGSDGGKRKKKNIERINLISSDEEDDEDQDSFSENAKGKQRERTPHIPSNLLRPVRIQRQEHVERTVGVNTDASSLTSAKLRQRAKDHQDAGSSLFLNEDDAGVLTTTKAKGRRKPKDVEFVRNERKWKGVYQDEDIQGAPAKIKDEPKDDEEFMVTKTPVPNREREPMAMDEKDGGVPLHRAIERSLPQPGKTLKATETLDESGKAFDNEDLPRPSQRRPRTVKFIGNELALTATESEELFADVSEMLAAQADIQENSLTSAPATATKGHDADSETDMDNKADDIFLDDEEERYGYVFQLPPIIPSLRDASKKVISPKTEKKIKPKGNDQAPSSNPFNVHPKDGNTIKSDPDDLTREPTYPNAYIAGGLYAPGGQVGVLNIYKKGPMRAFWGGMSLEISKGESGDMVPQEMVLTDFTNTVTKVEDESRWEEKVSVGEKIWAMGQTQRGFVCVPDWGALLL
ncbi:hypothetical protein N7G274_009798 [Stereocaulon virgatum]|uniref:Uncharacterized protein n=1 Tax=Stereocaulon virgatum TaxID=373712 RepID=A0ABR3ZZK3_9LECA